MEITGQTVVAITLESLTSNLCYILMVVKISQRSWVLAKLEGVLGKPDRYLVFMETTSFRVSRQMDCLQSEVPRKGPIVSDILYIGLIMASRIHLK